MKLILPKNNLSSTQRICFAGLLIALIAILQKVAAINYIPVVPFLRLSLGGPCLIIFSSILLGPLYGAIIGGASDLLGYLIFDPKTMSPFPQITMIYIVLGFASYFIFAIVKSIKNTKAVFGVEIGSLIAMIAICSVYLFTHSTINLYGTVYQLALVQKIIIIAVAVLLSVVVIVFTFIMHKKEKKDKLAFDAYQKSFALLIIELVIMVGFGSWMKGKAFGMSSLPIILACQILTAFFNYFVNSILLTILIRISSKKLYFQRTSLFV